MNIDDRMAEAAETDLSLPFALAAYDKGFQAEFLGQLAAAIQDYDADPLGYWAKR